MILELYNTNLWLAEAPLARATSPIEAVVVFSGPQFFVALVAGVLMAFAFQFLLTNFTVATDISTAANPLEADSAQTWGGKIRKVESKLGVWVLATVNTALFIACFLAVKLTLINSTALGAITGIVIWSAFFLVLIWISSQAVNSLLGSVVSTTSFGLQGIIDVATTALGGRSINAQVVNTVEESVAAVRRQLGSAVDSTTVREQLQDYLKQLQPPRLDLQGIRSDFENLLQSSDIKSISDRDLLKKIDRQSFVDLVSSRTDLSKQEVHQIAEQLEKAWQQVINQQQTKETIPNQQGSPVRQQAVEVGVNALVKAVLSRTDLANLDSEKFVTQLQKLIEQGTAQTQQAVKQFSPSQLQTIGSDVKDYLLQSKPWHLNRETIRQEFRELIYDPDADPGLVHQQLERLNRDDFVQILRQRDQFTPEKINEIANQLERIRKEVLQQVQGAESEQQSKSLRTQIENYLRSTGKEELNPEGIERDLTTLLQNPEIGFEQLRDRLSQFDRDTFVQMLKESRQDLSEEEANNIVNQMERVRDRALSRVQDWQEQAKSKTEQLKDKIESYLQNTNKEQLNPEGIRQDLQTLLEEPQMGIKALRERFSQFDRDTFVKLLSQRQDLSEEQINQIVDQIQDTIDSVVKAPRRLSKRVVKQAQSWETQLEDYLRNADKEELNPEGIKRDLQLLLQQPGFGLQQMRDRLSQFDRSTFVALLSQREDISEEEANQIVDRIESARDQLLAQIQKVQDQVQSVIDGVFNTIRDYLNSLDRPELNYEGIQHDLRQLFEDPEAGWDALRDRLSQFDRDTLVALLSSNERISQAEANRLIGNVEQVRDRVLHRAENLQQQAQERINQIRQNAYQQVQETRKVAATAAWWLLGTALTSVGTAAFAGVLAVRGFGGMLS